MKKILLTLWLIIISLVAQPQKPEPGLILLDFNGYILEQDEIPIIPRWVYMSALMPQSLQEETMVELDHYFQRWDLTITRDEKRYQAYNPQHRIRVVITSSFIGDVGGYSLFGSFTDSLNTSIFVSSPNAEYRPNIIAQVIAHELGHSLGLQHQSVFVGEYKLAEYNRGTPFKSPIMGVSYWSLDPVWWKGTASDGSYQDDQAIIDQVLSQRPLIYMRLNEFYHN